MWDESIQRNFFVHLAILDSLGVQKALQILIFNCLSSYLQKCSSIVPLADLERWVNGLEEKYQRGFDQYKHTKAPHVFLLWLFLAYKDAVLREGVFHRENNPANDQERLDIAKVSEMINGDVSKLPFEDGVAYLARLTAGWILTCPEAIIRRDPSFKNIVEHYKKTQLASGRPSAFDIHLNADKPAEVERTENERLLIFVLDYQLYQATDWWVYPQ